MIYLVNLNFSLLSGSAFGSESPELSHKESGRSFRTAANRFVSAKRRPDSKLTGALSAVKRRSQKGVVVKDGGI